MTAPSPIPPQSLFPVVPLSELEAEAFLSGFTKDFYTSHTEEELIASFKSLSADTQGLLVRSHENGLISKQTLLSRLEDVSFTVFHDGWSESSVVTASEAIAIADARLFSSLLVLNYLGESLCALGRGTSDHLIWSEAILNEFVSGPRPEGAYRGSAAYRLSTMDDVAVVAGITTYVAVDTYLHDKEVEAHGRDHREPLVAVVPGIHPRSSDDGQGVHCDYMLIYHPELEFRLRGRSFNDYEYALRIALERKIGGSAEDAEGVMEQLALTRPASSGFL